MEHASGRPVYRVILPGPRAASQADCVREAVPCTVRLRQEPSAYSPRWKPRDSGSEKGPQAPKRRQIRVRGERPVAPLRGLKAQCGGGKPGASAPGYRLPPASRAVKQGLRTGRRGMLKGYLVSADTLKAYLAPAARSKRISSQPTRSKRIWSQPTRSKRIWSQPTRSKRIWPQRHTQSVFGPSRHASHRTDAPAWGLRSLPGYALYTRMQPGPLIPLRRLSLL